LTARADDPSAVFYNPAGVAELEGLQLAGGLDFNNATDEYSSATAGGFFADHVIEFPPSLYLTWNDEERFGRWAFGLGLDTAEWYRVDWDPVFFPPRFNVRLSELELWQLHPVAAYRLNDEWSLGGGLRYLYGSSIQGVNAALGVEGSGGQVFPAEVVLDADANVDGYGFDFGTRYHSTLWGFGAVYRSAVDVEGSGDLSRGVRDAPLDAEAAANLAALLANAGRSFDTSLDLPWEMAVGFWFAPYPELRFELDAVLAGWSDFEQTFRGSTVDGTPLPRSTLQSGWDDTLSLRLAVEGEVTESILVSGGVALEPSPVPDDRVSPAWFRGDATVYGVGASFVFERVTFDLGYSLHDHDSVTVRGQEPDAPDVRGTYSSDDQVWSISARYRF
jgi:long-chain fatty acid transport protein